MRGLDLEGERRRWPIDRRARDPPAAPEQVCDDVARLAPGLESRRNELRRWRRRDPLEGKEVNPGSARERSSLPTIAAD